MYVEELSEAAREKLVTITDDAMLVEAAKLLTSGTDIVVVWDGEGALHGVVTKTDVGKQISVCQGATCMCPVSTVMTRDVALCLEADSLQDVSFLMKERHLKNIPVVDGDNQSACSPLAPFFAPIERCRVRRSPVDQLRERHWISMIEHKAIRPNMRNF